MSDGNAKDAKRRMPLFPEFSYGIHPSFSKSLIALLADSAITEAVYRTYGTAALWR
jgi:hypothetical protein